MSWKVYFDKAKFEPVKIEWNDISGGKNEITISEFTMQSPPSVVFTVPEHITFEDVSDESR